MNGKSIYVTLAEEIHNMPAYNKLSELMSSYENLEEIFLRECDKSEKLLFAACQILTKKLMGRHLLISPEQTQNTQQAQSFQAKKFLLFRISSKLYEIVRINASKIQKYVIKSCLNTISVCIFMTVSTNSSFDSAFIEYLQMMVPDFIVNYALVKPVDSQISFVQGSSTPLGVHHEYCIQILNSLLEYTTNSTYFQNYYQFRRNLYAFRNNYLVYYLNYAIFTLKSMLSIVVSIGDQLLPFSKVVRPTLTLFQNLVMYPFSLNLHEFQIEDDIHENISGLQSEIYFPSYFRSLLCDTSILMDIIDYYSKITAQANDFEQIRSDIYALIRIIARILSTSQYVFVGGDNEKKAFRALTAQFVTKVLKQNRFFDSYLILCLTKINIKFMSVQNEQHMFMGNKIYFDSLRNFILRGIRQSRGKIQDGEKHPYRQLFQLLTAFVNITANTIMDQDSKICAQQAMNILLKQRLIDNNQNSILMKQFGFNNGQQIDCFAQVFGRIPQIFKINLAVNLTTLHQLNTSMLNGQSHTFWLHLTSLLLPQHDTSLQQTQLIIKFLTIAIQACSIASLHFIQVLMQQILYEIKNGQSTTYLWKFIQESKGIKFDQFLSYIIQYAMKILAVPNYVLIQNCLILFKAVFTKLCKHRHQSFVKYFQIIQQVCKEIDKTMLVRPQFVKLRIGFFSIISIIWVNGGQVSFVYRIFQNIRQTLNQNHSLVHFMRYLTDITGLLEPVESSDMYKLLVELFLDDIKNVIPIYFGTPEKLAIAFGDQSFLKTFIRFIFTLVNDTGFRMTLDSHTELPFEIEQIFKPFLIQALKFEYPQKMVQTWIKFIKLNPLGKLLPLDKSLKQKNSPIYKMLIREYFQNLHRLQSLQDFYYIYTFIDDNIDLLVDWWQQIMIRDFKPEIDISLITQAHLWKNTRQKEHFGKLLFRIAKYDSRFWKIQCQANNQVKYAEWFVANFK